jgi:PIN domain nuclease of toxin-antitoxin system
VSPAHLLDTHAFLWYITADPRLSRTAAAAIGDPAAAVYVSVVAAWEMVIKAAKGKLRLHKPLPALWADSIAANGFTPLDVTFDHVLALESLPRHHDDPFDRLIVAQAVAEGLNVVSADRALAGYPVTTIW